MTMLRAHLSDLRRLLSMVDEIDEDIRKSEVMRTSGGIRTSYLYQSLLYVYLEQRMTEFGPRQ